MTPTLIDELISLITKFLRSFYDQFSNIHFIEEFTGTYIVSDLFPRISSNSSLLYRLNKSYSLSCFILVFEDHPYMIEVSSCYSTNKRFSNTMTFKEQHISSFNQIEKLLFRNFRDFPEFWSWNNGSVTCLVTVWFLNVICNMINPWLCLRFRFCLENKVSFSTKYSYLKLSFAQ